jgi:hypothetical protein
VERLGPLCRQPYTGTVREPIFSPLQGAHARSSGAPLPFRMCRAPPTKVSRRRSHAHLCESAGQPVRLQPDVLVGHTTGVVAALNRPGGNLTGVTSLNAATGPKRLAPVRQLIAKAAVAAGTACSLSWRPWQEHGRTIPLADHSSASAGPRTSNNVGLGALTLLECSRWTRRDGVNGYYLR